MLITHDLALTEIAMNGLAGCNVHFEGSGESASYRSITSSTRECFAAPTRLNIAHMLGIDTAAQQC